MSRFLLGGLLATVLCVFVAPGEISAQVVADTQSPLEILYGFTLIDGAGGTPVADGAIAVRGSTIVDTGTRDAVVTRWDKERNVLSIDLGGGFVVPGLIDAHVHLGTVPNRQRAEAELYRHLYSGITSVRDMAGDGRALASLARDSRLGEIDAPDLYYSALMAGPSFLSDPRPQASAAGGVAGEVPWMQAITSDTEMVRAVARAKGTWATGVKVYANLEPNEVMRITEEAHRQGMKVWAHSMVFPTRPLEVVTAGVDVVSHVCRLAWEAMSDAPDEYHHGRLPDYDSFTIEAEVFTEIFREMRERGTILDATLAMYARFDRMAEANPDNAPPVRCRTDFARQLVRRAHEEGVAIAAGTDFGTPPGAPYPALHDEIEELVEHGGLSAMDAIGAATRVAARVIGIEESHGTLEPGKTLNFVLLDQDPIADIENLRTVRAVWKNAARFDRADYAPKGRLTVAGPDAATMDTSTPAELLDSWVALWRSYDLDRVPALFLNDDAVSYFSSEFEGLIQGPDALVEHHRGFGFVSGGTEAASELWVEDAQFSDVGETVVVGGVWYFGDRADRANAGRGPMTMVLVQGQDGWRIAHMHFANYPGS